MFKSIGILIYRLLFGGAFMSKADFKVVYDGPALANHEMDINELAPALLAISQAIEEANYVLHGDRSKAAVSVRGSFKTGCFGIDLALTQSFVDQMADLLNGRYSTAASSLLTWLGYLGGASYSLLRFIAWVRGRKITRIEVLRGDARRVYIDNEHYETELQVLELYRNIKVRRALEEAVAKPLERPGVDSFAIHDPKTDEIVQSIDKSQSEWFRAPLLEEELIDETEITVRLQLVSISFQEDNKWRFSDGNSTFYASLKDVDFIARVQKNEESFSRGDILKARVHKRQWIAGEEIKAEYSILEVLEHRRAAAQINLPMEEPPSSEPDDGGPTP